MINVSNNVWDKFREWSGTAAELAETAGRLLPLYRLETEPPPNERLVRYYVTERALSRPVKEGREARFGFRQLMEFLAVRVLLADGWTLARIGDFTESADETTLLSVLPEAAEEPASESLFSEGTGTQASLTDAERLVAEFTAHYDATPLNRRKPASVAPSQIAPPEAVRQRAQSKQDIRAALNRLGINADFPPRTADIKLTIAPWCDVRIGTEALVKALDAAIRKSGETPDNVEQWMADDAVRAFRAAIEKEIGRSNNRRT